MDIESSTGILPVLRERRAGSLPYDPVNSPGQGNFFPRLCKSYKGWPNAICSADPEGTP